MTIIPVLKSLSESDLSINRNSTLLLSETTSLIINSKSLSKLKTKPNSSLLIKSTILKPLNKKSLPLLLMISLIMLFLVFSIVYRILGINGTIFCYGQTSSGKTHTIVGDYSTKFSQN